MLSPTEQKFFTQYTFVPDPGEENSGESIVDPSGYIPAKDRIENILRAGERLDAYRREMYHYGPDDEDDGYEDPVMEPGFDPADASRMQREALSRLRAASQTESQQKEPSTVESTVSEAISGSTNQTEATSAETKK